MARSIECYDALNYTSPKCVAELEEKVDAAYSAIANLHSAVDLIFEQHQDVASMVARDVIPYRRAPTWDRIKGSLSTAASLLRTYGYEALVPRRD